MKSYTTLIIDDEKLARERLKKLLAGFNSTFNIIGEAKNGNQAEQLILNLQPDIIFLDIEMPGKNGFELIQSLPQLPIVIFCTAHEEYALKAFDTNSIDYLVKPVKLERLEQTINKLQTLQQNLTSAQLQQVMQEIAQQKSAKKMTSITVKKKDKILFLKLEDVTYFEAQEKYVSIHTNQSTELIEQSLTKLEERLPDHFLRVHRKYVINIHFIQDFQKYFNSRYIITLKDRKKTSITSGRSYKEQLTAWMDL
jgi:two-component system LytT family response regulator